MLRKLFIAIGLVVGVTSTSYAADPQAVVERAKATVETMRSDASFGNSMELLHRAKAVMIVPQLVKGGFMFGAEGGKGVLVVHHQRGWSDPAFYGIGAGSFGLQIGLEEAELVMFVMSDRALHAWMKNEVKLGVNAGLTVLVVGSSAEADATTNANVDVIAWAKSKGAYAGITLSGSVIKPLPKDDAAYYGHPVTTAEILHNFGYPGAETLRGALKLDNAVANDRR